MRSLYSATRCLFFFFAGVLFPILEAVLTVEEACNEDTTFFSSSELQESVYRCAMRTFIIFFYL